SVYAWGNPQGSTPVRVQGLPPAVAIEAGTVGANINAGTIVAAVTHDETVWTWEVGGSAPTQAPGVVGAHSAHVNVSYKPNNTANWPTLFARVRALVEISPSTIDFGWVGVGQQASKTVTVTNTGLLPVLLGQHHLDPYYNAPDLRASSWSGFPTVSHLGKPMLTPGHSFHLTVTFAPTLGADNSVTLRLGVDKLPGSSAPGMLIRARVM
ncbi:MAG: hypothetical protein ACJ76S_08385, partial [Solirubrobacteraceae bacterium]